MKHPHPHVPVDRKHAANVATKATLVAEAVEHDSAKAQEAHWIAERDHARAAHAERMAGDRDAFEKHRSASLEHQAKHLYHRRKHHEEQEAKRPLERYCTLEKRLAECVADKDPHADFIRDEMDKAWHVLRACDREALNARGPM